MEEVKYGEDNYEFRVSNTNTLIDGNLKVTGKIIGGNDMMGLYEVFVVNKKRSFIVGDTIIAKDERIAERKVIFPGDWNLDDLVFFTRCIGQWKSEKPQKVKIVKE